jgi:gliding motility-associated-like protein
MTFVARITIFFLVLISFYANAQFQSRLGRFQVDQIKGCVPLTINVTSPGCGLQPDGVTTIPCDMYFGDSPTAQNLAFTHTYTQPGTYLFQILYPSGQGFDDIQIVVSPNTPPAFELYTCAGNQIAINITDTNFENYFVNWGDGLPETKFQRTISLRGSYSYPADGTRNVSVRGINNNSLDNCSGASQTINVMGTLPLATIHSLQVLNESSIRVAFNGQPNIVYRLEVAPNNAPSFQVLKTLYNVTADTIRNIKTDDNFYCYRLGVVNPCTGAIQYSPVICSANVDLAVQNNQNVLTWQTRMAGVNNFRVTRTTSGSSIVATVGTSPYADTDISCGREYCYQLTTLYPNGAQSTSLVKCGTAISTDIPDAIDNISSIVNGTTVNLNWLADPDFLTEGYTVYKNISDVYNTTFKNQSPAVTDPSYSTEVEACYKVQYTDVCGNQSPMSPEACPIRLTASLQNDNTISLSWTEYNGWASGVNNYTIQKYTPEGALLQTFSATTTSFVDDTEDLLHQALIYVVTATPAQPGIAPSVSNRIVIVKNPNVFYPKAFTPNGDNLNDIFNVYGQFIEDFEMSIFNRWGELMYTTMEISEGWDGSFKGNKMPEGTYTFIVRIVDRAGRNIKESGSVLLLRKN